VFARATAVRTRLEVPHQLAGPLRWHAVVGTAFLLADGRTIARIPLLLAHALPAVSPPTLAAAFLTRPFTIASVAILLAAVVVTTMLWRHRSRERAVGATTRQ
jgi:hypothetical protein